MQRMEDQPASRRALHHCGLFEPRQGVAVVAADFEHYSNRLALVRCTQQANEHCDTQRFSIEIWSVQQSVEQGGNAQSPAAASGQTLIKQLCVPHAFESAESLQWCGSRCLVVTQIDGRLAQYCPASGRLEYQAQLASCPIWCSAWNAEQSFLACGLDNSSVLLVDIASDEKPHTRAVHTLPFMRRIEVDRDTPLSHTVVWSLAYALQGRLLCSGDSRGKTAFWSTADGTLLTSHQMHAADVLAVAVDAAGFVYSAGVEPKLQVFRAQYDADDPKRCTNFLPFTAKQKLHTHDVRCLLAIGDGTASSPRAIISAGVDGGVVLSSAVGQQQQQTATNLHSAIHWPYQLTPGVDCAFSVCRQPTGVAPLLAFVYGDQLQLWRGAQTNVTPLPALDGSRLAQCSHPLKLLAVQTKRRSAIVAVALSADGSLLAYSTTQHTTLLRIRMLQDGEPSVTAVQCTTHSQLPAARALAFVPSTAHDDSLNAQQQLLLVVNSSAENGGHSAPAAPCLLYRAHIADVQCGLSLLPLRWPAAFAQKPDVSVSQLAAGADGLLLFVTTNHRVYIAKGNKVSRVPSCPRAVPVAVRWLPGARFALLWHTRMLTIHQVEDASGATDDGSDGHTPSKKAKTDKTDVRVLLSQSLVDPPFGLPARLPPPVWLDAADDGNELLIASKNRLVFVDTHKLLLGDGNASEYVKSTDKLTNICTAFFLPLTGNTRRLSSHSADSDVKSDVCVVELSSAQIMQSLPPVLKLKKFGVS